MSSTEVSSPRDGNHVVFSETSPYGSRMLIVESDGSTTAAYLHGTDDEGALHGAVWLANHVPGPAGTGRPPVRPQRIPAMPADATKHPSGRSLLGDLSVLWFEEGDGAALYEAGELLAVIPGWADLAQGMPGYARDALIETPFAWPLDEAMEGLEPRVDRARSYWNWRWATGRWGAYRTSVLTHLRDRIGPPGNYWDTRRPQLPKIGISEHAADGYTIISTVGMGCQRMPTVEQYTEDPGRFARIELAVATRGDAQTAARIFLWLGHYPWQSVTWLGHGHTARWYHSPTTFPLDSPATSASASAEEWAGVLLLADGLPGTAAPPDLSGFMHRDDPVRWIWLLPVTGSEMRTIAERGPDAFAKTLTRPWILP